VAEKIAEKRVAIPFDKDRQREFLYTLSDFETVRKLIYEHAGISLNDTKYEMVYSRLVRRLRALGCNSFKSYLHILEDGNNPEWEFFINALTTNRTEFFREPHHFSILTDHIRNHCRHLPSINIWSAATSSGEEAYSIAIVMAELFQSNSPPVKILATDLDTNVLEKARNAVYSLEQVQTIPSSQVKRYFLKGEGANEGFVKVKEEIRKLITFRRINLLENDWRLSEVFDIVFCRNVMIYFDKNTQYQVLKKITRVLKPEGLLFAGHSESFFHATDLVASCGKTVYKRVS
jgi:chemotaxis protein methyltransferase CheR